MNMMRNPVAVGENGPPIMRNTRDGLKAQSAPGDEFCDGYKQTLHVVDSYLNKRTVGNMKEHHAKHLQVPTTNLVFEVVKVREMPKCLDTMPFLSSPFIG